MGQALVEAVLTLPLMIFLILATIQIFLMQQARIMTEYAVVRATRAGSVNFGNCRAMTHSAIAALLPTFAGVDDPVLFGAAFGKFKTNAYPTSPGPLNFIVEVFRNEALLAGVADDKLENFDMQFTPGTPYNPTNEQLEVELVFWYPLRIPFADWVLTKMFQAQYGAQVAMSVNPTMVYQRNPQWSASPPPGAPKKYMIEYLIRAAGGEHVFPITAHYAMRMMTQPKPEFLGAGAFKDGCRLGPP